jgi:hypothetical protein
MRKYEVKDIKEKLEESILTSKMNIYCYELIIDLYNENSDKFENVTKRIEKLFIEKLEGNIYGIKAKYQDVYYLVGSKEILFYNRNKNFDLNIFLKKVHFDNTIEWIDIELIKVWLENAKKGLNRLENELNEVDYLVNTFNNIMDNLEEFYKRYEYLDYLLEVKKY